ncbi:MAG: hypothetical protein KTR31_21350 [Myxococcales bacterium]|nr:hypothetical protein [Myxococcales bacterium]
MTPFALQDPYDGHDPWLAHKRRLLQRRRCPHCAERAGPGDVLYGQACRSCGRPLRLEGTEDHLMELLTAIRQGWARRRLLVYGAVLGATFIAGWIPFLSAVATAVAMLLANLLLVRRPLMWLPLAQRFVTRFAVRAWLLFLLVCTVVLNTLAATALFAPGVGPAVSAVTGLASTFLYIEGALWMVQRSVLWSVDSPTGGRNVLLVPVVGTVAFLAAGWATVMGLGWLAQQATQLGMW